MHPRSIHVCCDAGCAQLLRTERPRAALLPLGALHVAVFIARDALSVWCALLPFGVAYPRLVWPALRLVCAAVCLVWPALHLVWLTGARPGAFLGFCSCEPHPIKTEAHQTQSRAHQTRIRTHQMETKHTKREAGHANVVAGEGLTRIACRGRAAYRGQFPYRPCLPGANPVPALLTGAGRASAPLTRSACRSPTPGRTSRPGRSSRSGTDRTQRRSAWLGRPCRPR